MSSPTQRSLKLLRDRGYRAAVVERRVPFKPNVTIDLFGIIDIVAVRDGETLGVQTTSYSNVSARVRKITESEAIADVRAAGWSVVVHGWRKVGRFWRCREVDVS